VSDLPSTRPSAGLITLIAVAVVLSIAAVAVRGIAAERVPLPKDVVEETPRIAEPMQLLARGAKLRAAELDAWIAPARRPRFQAARETLFHLADCPKLLEWIDGVEGQRIERLLAELRNGTREEALGALALLLQLARATEWQPGLLARSEHAERLGGLFQDWLRVWGERGARDPTLSDPVLAASLVYARAMRSAWNAPVVGHNEPPYARARTFLGELSGIPLGKRTAFGEALQSRYAHAAAKLLADGDFLFVWEQEAGVLFPDVTGECDG
jgi:hypothetical protein